MHSRLFDFIPNRFSPRHHRFRMAVSGHANRRDSVARVPGVSFDSTGCSWINFFPAADSRGDGAAHEPSGSPETNLPDVAQSSRTFSQSNVPSNAGPLNSQFQISVDSGAIVSLKRTRDAVDTDYLGGRRFGDVAITFRRRDGDWQSVQTANLAQSAARRRGTAQMGAGTAPKSFVVVNENNLRR